MADASNVSRTVTVTKNFTSQGAPGMVGSVTVVSHSNNGQPHMDISWATLTETGGYPISGYDIGVSDDGKASWTRLATNVLPDGNTYHVSGTKPHVQYYVRVRAVNSKGQSEWSVAGPLTVHGAPLVPPAFEATLTGCSIGPTCLVSLTWGTSTVGADPESYSVRIQKADGSEDTIEVTNLPASTRSHSFTLGSYGRYSAGVQAVNTPAPAPGAKRC